jgi:hypothetical protein
MQPHDPGILAGDRSLQPSKRLVGITQAGVGFGDLEFVAG